MLGTLLMKTLAAMTLMLSVGRGARVCVCVSMFFSLLCAQKQSSREAHR